MSKVIDDAINMWDRIIINPDETPERSDDMISYAMNSLKSLRDDNKVITSMKISVNFCDTDTPVGSDNAPARANILALLEKSLLVMDTSVGTEPPFTDGKAIARHEGGKETIRDSLIRYMEVIESRGMLNRWQYMRFVEALRKVYSILSGGQESTSVDSILDSLNLGYVIKYYPPTVACPDAFWKLSNYKTPNTISECKISPVTIDKIDRLMKKWFSDGGGKIYDKDREEFYAEFMTIYNSDTRSENEEGVIDVVRRPRSKQLMAMKPLINYSDINRILKLCGLNYYITYKQENDAGKRKNALALKGEF